MTVGPVTDRLRELAKEGAFALHLAYCDAGVNALLPHAHPFATCPHPDCVLVREAATEPPTDAQTPRVEARRDQIDGAEPALREQKTARHWLIWNAKRGLWWGPDRGGYTDLIRAGLYTEAEAKAQEHDKERMEKAVHISEYRSEVLQAERLIDALYDVDEAVLASSQSALPAAHGSAHPQEPTP